MFYFIDDDGEEDGEEEESDDDEDDDEDDGEMTLSDLYNKKLDDDEDGEDFVEGDEEEDDDEIDDEDEPSTKKPKVDDNNEDANWNNFPKLLQQSLEIFIINKMRSVFLFYKSPPTLIFPFPFKTQKKKKKKTRRKWRKHFSVHTNDSFEEEPLKKLRFLKKKKNIRRECFLIISPTLPPNHKKEVNLFVQIATKSGHRRSLDFELSVTIALYYFDDE